jgi:anionic cell wall polymer biosynthesis LytR-Cps2A-Psr (LCP) family protein
MSAILNSAKHSNPFKLYNMAFKSAPYIETDMTKGELMSFVAQAGYCITGSMHQTKVPFDNTWSYATISGNSVISIDTEENKEMLIDYLYNKSSADITAEETSE